MSKKIYKYIGLFPIYVLLQVFILNEILFASYINPYIYILLIITLPRDTPNWFLLIYGFLLGFTIDIFTGSIGFHSTATVLISFLKPLISKLIIPHNIISDQDELQLQRVGLQPFSIFTLILTIVHHATLFLIETLSLSNFFELLIKICFSSVVTSLLIIITQLLYFRKK